MVRRSDAEQRLLEKAGRYLPGGTGGNLSFPKELDFLVSHGKGSRVWDVDGNEYIDFVSGHGALLLGHSHPDIAEAVGHVEGKRLGVTGIVGNPVGKYRRSLGVALGRTGMFGDVIFQYCSHFASPFAPAPVRGHLVSRSGDVGCPGILTPWAPLAPPSRNYSVEASVASSYSC